MFKNKLAAYKVLLVFYMENQIFSNFILIKMQEIAWETILLLTGQEGIACRDF